VFTGSLVTASNDVASSPSMFTSLLAGDCLTTNSALLRNDLKQCGFLRLPGLYQVRLSHNGLRLGLVRLLVDSRLSTLLGLTGTCFDSPDIASVWTHRGHRFRHFLHCYMTHNFYIVACISIAMLTWISYSIIGSLFTVP
jgi:hypothetical protein